jgi:hypothetical protein
MGNLAIYNNICDNIKNGRWDAVWHDSFLLEGGGNKIRRLLCYDPESDNACLAVGVYPATVQYAADQAFSGL